MCQNHAVILVEGNSNITFINNIAQDNGGALKFGVDSSFILKDTSTILFINNRATSEGALSFQSFSAFIMYGNAMVTFSESFANEGAAMTFVENSNVILKSNISVMCTGGGSY